MEWDGLWYAAHRDVYEPSDDTFLLARVTAEHVAPGDRVLEVGCGAGLVAMAAARAGARVTATDANPAAVRLAVDNARQNGLDLEGVTSDLLGALRGPFDVVVFNPPYLPTVPADVVEGPLNMAFDGGPAGSDVVLRFAAQLERLVGRPREVLIVHSNLSEVAPLKAALAGLGYTHEVAANERHFFEELTVRRFYRS